ncbi:MAG: heavy metal transporter [Flavobacteriaceae bacterium]|nr:MAG: heavy metal transporter [Flavobacteriaceae bacterium]
MKNLIYTIAIIAFTFTSCKGEKKEASGHEGHDHSTETKMDAPRKTTDTATVDSKDLANGIIDSYLQLKNALTNDDEKGAATAGTAMLNAFAAFDMTQVTGDAHKIYMEIAESSKEHAEHIVKSPMDHQREHFEVLTTDMIDLIAALGTNKTLYQDFCPMYNGNKGAAWISEFKEIKNPYFGARMLSCGKVQKQFN